MVRSIAFSGSGKVVSIGANSRTLRLCYTDTLLEKNLLEKKSRLDMSMHSSVIKLSNMAIYIYIYIYIWLVNGLIPYIWNTAQYSPDDIFLPPLSLPY